MRGQAKRENGCIRAPPLEFDGGARPGRVWIESLALDPDWEETALRISDLGAPEADGSTVEAVVRLAERSERDLRFALETSLLAVGRRDGRRLQTSAARAQRASLPLRALAAPDERLPAILEARVHLLIERMTRPLPATAGEEPGAGFAKPGPLPTGSEGVDSSNTNATVAGEAGTGTLSPSEGTSRAEAKVPTSPQDWLASRLADVAEKAGWAMAGVVRVRAAFVDNEVLVDEESLDLFEYLVGKYDASPRFVECAFEVRRWCESEGYGRRYEDLDPETHVYAPPSFESMFRFVHHFAETPESEEAVATLDDWIRQRFIDPRDFENDLFRHLRLIAYADPDDAK